MRNLISFPQKFRRDRTSIQAVASISEDASYFEETVETSEEIPESEPAKPVTTVDNSTPNEAGTLELKSHYSLADIPEDSVPLSSKPISNVKAEQGLLDFALAAPETIVQDENLSHTQPQGTSKASLWTRLRRNRIEQNLNNSSKALTSRPKKPSARPSATEKWGLDPKSLYFASADNMIKIVIVGDSDSLKTRLLITYTTGKYPSEYVPTVFDNYSVTVLVGTEKWTLGLWDTAGQEDYDRLRPLSYPQTDLFLICANRSYLREYERAKDMWAPELHPHLPHVPRILVGVQDFEDENTVDRMQYGMKLASEIGAEMYLECDLLTMKGVKELFDEAIATALSRVLTKEELKREKEKEKKAQLEAAAKKAMEEIKEDP